MYFDSDDGTCATLRCSDPSFGVTANDGLYREWSSLVLGRQTIYVVAFPNDPFKSNTVSVMDTCSVEAQFSE